MISARTTERSAARRTSGRWTDRTAVSTLREIALMATMFMLYRQVRHLTSGDLDQAMSNADRVVGIERSFGAFSERSLQRLVMHSRLGVDFLDHYYVFVHFTASFGFMAWVFLRHPDAWGRIRSWFLSVTVAGLVIHVMFPLAPPRMLADEGFVDTLHVYGPSIYSRDVTHSAANQLAAMPSLHFAWAVIVAAGFISISRSQYRWLVILHPVVPLMAIVATANHYWLDATVGGILVAAAIAASVVRPMPSFGRIPAVAQLSARGPAQVVARALVPGRPQAADRLRIARLSTITAVPVLARPMPNGRRHDLNRVRPRRASSHRRDAKGPAVAGGPLPASSLSVSACGSR